VAINFLASNENVNRNDGGTMLDLWNNFTEKLKQHAYPNIMISSEIIEGETHTSVFPRAYTNGIKSIFKNYTKK